MNSFKQGRTHPNLLLFDSRPIALEKLTQRPSGSRQVLPSRVFLTRSETIEPDLMTPSATNKQSIFEDKEPFETQRRDCGKSTEAREESHQFELKEKTHSFLFKKQAQSFENKEKDPSCSAEFSFHNRSDYLNRVMPKDSSNLNIFEQDFRQILTKNTRESQNEVSTEKFAKLKEVKSTKARMSRPALKLFKKDSRESHSFDLTSTKKHKEETGNYQSSYSLNELIGHLNEASVKQIEEDFRQKFRLRNPNEESEVTSNPFSSKTSQTILRILKGRTNISNSLGLLGGAMDLLKPNGTGTHPNPSTPSKSSLHDYDLTRRRAQVLPGRSSTLIHPIIHPKEKSLPNNEETLEWVGLLREKSSTSVHFDIKQRIEVTELEQKLQVKLGSMIKNHNISNKKRILDKLLDKRPFLKIVLDHFYAGDPKNFILSEKHINPSVMLGLRLLDKKLDKLLHKSKQMELRQLSGHFRDVASFDPELTLSLFQNSSNLLQEQGLPDKIKKFEEKNSWKKLVSKHTKTNAQEVEQAYSKIKEQLMKLASNN